MGSEKKVCFFFSSLCCYRFVVLFRMLLRLGGCLSCICDNTAAAVLEAAALSERRRKFYCTVLWPGFIGMLTLYICIAKLHTHYFQLHYTFACSFAIACTIPILSLSAVFPLVAVCASALTPKIFDSCHMNNQLTGLHIFIPASLLSNILRTPWFCSSLPLVLITADHWLAPSVRLLTQLMTIL